jgi:hypothetical protein
MYKCHTLLSFVVYGLLIHIFDGLSAKRMNVLMTIKYYSILNQGAQCRKIALYLSLSNIALSAVDDDKNEIQLLLSHGLII